MATRTIMTQDGLKEYMQLISVGTPTTSSVEADMTPYLASNYSQVRMGKAYDYEASIAHLVQLRTKIVQLTFDFEDYLVDHEKGKVASRHVSWCKMRDAAEVNVEVVLFFEVDGEGRIYKVTELSRSI